MGTCICWTGYEGSACTDCAAGFQAAAGLCQRAASSFAVSATAPAHSSVSTVHCTAPRMSLTASTAAAVASVNGTGQGTQGNRPAEPLTSSTLSQRAQQTETAHLRRLRSIQTHTTAFDVRLAVGIAIAAATALMALAAIAYYRRRRRRGADAGKPGLRQFAVGAPPSSPPTALPQEVGGAHRHVV